MNANIGELGAHIREHLQQSVREGLLDPGVVEEAAESITAIAMLHERGLITQRLADHLANKLGILLGERVANEQLAAERRAIA